mgnify:CR=1 FL=1
MKTKRFDVSSIGESMLRLSIPAGNRLENTRALDVGTAGAEGNVLNALGHLGRSCAWVSGLPDNPLGRLAANHLRKADVNLDGVIWRDAGRMGVYFVEFSTPPRPIQVIYDRVDSVIASLTPDQIDWAFLLDTRLLHLTGITPALSASCAAIVAESIQRAKAQNVPISFDMNYRGKLWTPEEARAAVTPLLQEIDLFFCARGDAEVVFDCTGEPEKMLQQLVQLSNARTVIMSIGEQGVIAWRDGQIYREPSVPVEVVDRIGAGDGLAAGVIHGWLKEDLVLGLRYGVTMAALALTEHGDTVTTSRAELDALVNSASGGVWR